MREGPGTGAARLRGFAAIASILLTFAGCSPRGAPIEDPSAPEAPPRASQSEIARLAREADLAWLRGEFANAREFCTGVLRLEPRNESAVTLVQVTFDMEYEGSWGRPLRDLEHQWQHEIERLTRPR